MHYVNDISLSIPPYVNQNKRQVGAMQCYLPTKRLEINKSDIYRRGSLDYQSFSNCFEQEETFEAVWWHPNKGSAAAAMQADTTRATPRTEERRKRKANRREISDQVY